MRSRSVPHDTLSALIRIRKRDRFDQDTLDLDMAALWNTKRFSDIRLRYQRGQAGLIVNRNVAERR
jgi:hypothetical protein